MAGVAFRSLFHLHQRAALRLLSRTTVTHRHILPCASYHGNRDNMSLISRCNHIKKKLLLLEPSNLHSSIVFIPKRDMAKRGISKERKVKKGTAKPKVKLSPEELSEVINYEKMIQQMNGALDSLKSQFMDQLRVRTNVGAFDNLVVETPDGNFPLIQLGQVVQKNPLLLVINMGAMGHYIPAVRAAILNSGMNLNPQQDGSSLIVPIPKITREHRENLVKSAKTLSDKTKDKLRDIQNKYVKDAKKEKDSHSSDLVHNVLETIHSTTHDYVEKTEQMLAAKQQELMGK